MEERRYADRSLPLDGVWEPILSPASCSERVSQALGEENLPEEEAKNTEPHSPCVAFNDRVEVYEPDVNKPAMIKHEPKPNSGSASSRSSIAMQREKMLKSVLGDDRYNMVKALGAEGELLDALFPVTTEEASALFPVDTWVDTSIEITLDSGCCEHVMDIEHAPGYVGFVTASAGSKRAQNFIVGNGEIGRAHV